jgi:hypothetical protein
LHETARQLTAKLDSKMAALGQLIREADRAAARLEAARSETSQPAAHSAGTQAPSQPTARSRDAHEALPPRPVSQAEALKPTSAVDAVSNPAGAASGDARRQPAAADRYDEIYLLSDYGFDTPEIARRVESPVGEVELILGLRPKR